MSHEPLPEDVLQFIKPQQVRGYALAKGWQRVPGVNGVAAINVADADYLSAARKLCDENDALLEEVIGLTLKDLLINQLILESDKEDRDAFAKLTHNEFDVPATLVPEREQELQNLLHFARERLDLKGAVDLSGRITAVEKGFAHTFPLVRPHLHKELRRYIVLRTLKKDHTRVTNRVKGLLANQGLRLPKGTDVGAVLDTLRLWDGSPLPAALHARLQREWEHARSLRTKLRELERRWRETGSVDDEAAYLREREAELVLAR